MKQNRTNQDPVIYKIDISLNIFFLSVSNLLKRMRRQVDSFRIQRR